MQVQPQLVLLQKTLLYIEGLGRQLYPQLDLWKTAKPFLEDWLKQQIGPQALWQQFKENLPFLAEKLPEMPELVHSYLQQQPKQQQQLLQQLLVLQQKQAEQSQRLKWSVFAASFILSSAVTYTAGAVVIAAALALVGLMLFIKSIE